MRENVMLELFKKIYWGIKTSPIFFPWAVVSIHEDGYTVLADRYEWKNFSLACSKAREANNNKDGVIHRVYGPVFRPSVDTSVC